MNVDQVGRAVDAVQAVLSQYLSPDAAGERARNIVTVLMRNGDPVATTVSMLTVQPDDVHEGLPAWLRPRVALEVAQAWVGSARNVEVA